VVEVTLKPGNKIDVLPAAAGRPFCRLTVTVEPAVTISVGPGTCMVLQNGVVVIAGAKLTDGRLQPYPHE